jgi:hypothetical protein
MVETKAEQKKIEERLTRQENNIERELGSIEKKFQVINSIKETENEIGLQIKYELSKNLKELDQKNEDLISVIFPLRNILGFKKAIRKKS